MEMIKYCPTCNRSSEDARFVGEFCEFCVADKIKLKLPKEVKVRRCRVCGMINGGRGFADPTEEAMQDAIRQQMHEPNCEPKLVSFDDVRNIAELKIECDLDEGPVRFPYEVKVKFTKEMCPNCYRRSAGYYEAIVQVRGNDGHVNAFIESFTRFLSKRNAFISKSEGQRNGIDFYVSDKGLVGEYFFIHKGIKPKVSYKLYGVKKGKRLYRHIYSVSLDSAGR